MQTEIEAKFIQQDHNAVRAKLKSLGAELVMAERTMRRANFDFPDLRLNDTQGGWVRVRDEGDKITLSYKQSDDTTVTGMQEVNLVINDFEEAIQFLKAVGITRQKALQETKRESWQLDGVAIELDTWPWLKPFVEIEAPTQEKLEQTAKLLGYSMQDALFGSVVPAYQAEYDITSDEMANWPEYKFSMPVPDWLEAKRKK